MQAIESCGQPYACLGDVRECRLAFNHDGDCATANRLASLEARTQAALEHWIF